MPLEPGNPKLGHIQLLFNAKGFLQQPPDCFGMKVKTTRKLHLLRRKGVPILDGRKDSGKTDLRLRLLANSSRNCASWLNTRRTLASAKPGCAMWCRVRIMVAPSNNPSTKGSLYYPRQRKGMRVIAQTLARRSSCVRE